MFQREKELQGVDRIQFIGTSSKNKNKENLKMQKEKFHRLGEELVNSLNSGVIKEVHKTNKIEAREIIEENKIFEWIKDKIYRVAFLITLIGSLGALVSNTNKFISDNTSSIDWFDFVFSFCVLIVLYPFISELAEDVKR